MPIHAYNRLALPECVAAASLIIHGCACMGHMQVVP